MCKSDSKIAKMKKAKRTLTSAGLDPATLSVLTIRDKPTTPTGQLLKNSFSFENIIQFYPPQPAPHCRGLSYQLRGIFLSHVTLPSSMTLFRAATISDFPLFRTFLLQFHEHSHYVCCTAPTTRSSPPWIEIHCPAHPRWCQWRLDCRPAPACFSAGPPRRSPRSSFWTLNCCDSASQQWRQICLVCSII